MSGVRVLIAKDGGPDFEEFARIPFRIGKYKIDLTEAGEGKLTIHVPAKAAVALTQHAAMFALSMTLYARGDEKKIRKICPLAPMPAKDVLARIKTPGAAKKKTARGGK